MTGLSQLGFSKLNNIRKLINSFKGLSGPAIDSMSGALEAMKEVMITVDQSRREDIKTDFKVTIDFANIPDSKKKLEKVIREVGQTRRLLGKAASASSGTIIKTGG